MTDLEMQEFKRQFDREARRLKLNMLKLPGLVATGTDWEVVLLDRMRALEPGATWQDVFLGLQLPEPDPHLANAIAAFDADPEAWWREHEVGEEVLREFRRLVPFPRQEATSDDQGFGWSLPEDPEYVLRLLRSLPDGAGWRAFRDALHSERPQE
jgi:hypothetical protein